MGDRARLGVHSAGWFNNHDHYFNDIHNHDNINHHDNGIDINDIKHSPTNNHKFIDKFNFFFFDNNFDIYNNPSSRNDHNDFNNSCTNNHANDNNKHNDDHPNSSNDHKFCTIYTSSNYDD